MATQEELTTQTICNVYMGVFLTPQPQQLSNLHNFCSKLLELYNIDGRYNEDKKILNDIFFNPISFLKNKYDDKFKLPKNPVDWNISNIEWAMYRSERFPTRLGKEFIVDTKKATNNKSLLLSQVLTIAYLYKREIDIIFNKILLKEKIQFSFNFENLEKQYFIGEQNK